MMLLFVVLLANGLGIMVYYGRFVARGVKVQYMGRGMTMEDDVNLLVNRMIRARFPWVGGYGNRGGKMYRFAQAGARQSHVNHSPRIPRIMHALFRDGDVYATALQNNGGWEFLTYDIKESTRYVRKWFPEYLPGFEILETEEERLNVFRYLVVLKFGGMSIGPSASYDVNLTSIVQPYDSFVAFWSDQYVSGTEALNECHIRQEGLRHEVFAATPMHPILSELVSRILMSNPISWKGLETFEIMERTGSGIFTDIILEYTLSREQNVRILPSSHFVELERACDAPWMTTASRIDTLRDRRSRSMENGDVENLIHTEYKNAIPAKHGDPVRLGGQSELGISQWFGKINQEARAETLGLIEHIAKKEAAHRLTPVSCMFSPAFDILTHRSGSGEWHEGSDVSTVLKSFGTWQPSVQPTREPSLTNVLVGLLGAKNDNGSKKLLVDVGAGYGLVSLAAAARGHSVRAFEVGRISFEALSSSIRWNGFEDLIRLEEVVFGNEIQTGTKACLRGSINISTDPEILREQQRGYGPKAVQGMLSSGCLDEKARLSGYELLKDQPIDVLKISANGWGGFVLEGFLGLLKNENLRASAVSLEWNPAQMRRAGYHVPMSIVQSMYDLGYRDISHSGYICDARWNSLAHSKRKQGSNVEAKPYLQRPTWCRLAPKDFDIFNNIGESSSTIETILFLTTL